MMIRTLLLTCAFLIGNMARSKDANLKDANLKEVSFPRGTWKGGSVCLYMFVSVRLSFYLTCL